MKITGLKVYQVDLPLHEGNYSWSEGKSVDVFDSTVVCVKTDTGVDGFGEVCPLGPVYLPSYAAGARAGMVAVDATTIDYVKNRPYAPQGEMLDRAIENWQQAPLHLRKVIAMCIPIVAATARQVAGSGVDLHHGNAGFDQSSGQQHALSADVIAVHHTYSRILTLQVVGILYGRTKQHVGRHFAEPIEAVVIGLGTDRAIQSMP